ncbi:MAG: hypothetical protein ACTHK0_13530 [Ginsengibacter sp.]
MKKTFMLLAALAIFTTSFSATGFSYIPKKASEIYIPIGKEMQISLKDLSIMNVKDYEKLSGKHMNFFQKLSFKAGQKKLRNSINADGTVSNKKLLKMMSADDHSVGFHLGGFALGFFLGLIGVLIAYIITGDNDVDRNRRKWAWIGFGIYVVLVVALVISFASSMRY